MMGRTSLTGVLAGVFVLSACGGGGSSSGGSPTTVGNPAPTPTPTPTSSPTPSPTYSTYSALSGNQQFALTCAGLEQDGFQSYASMPIAFGSDIQSLSYDAAADSWSVEGDVSQTFGPANAVTSSNPLVEEYFRIDNAGAPASTLLIAAPQPGGSTLEYTRVLYYQLPNAGMATTQNRNCVFGVPSDPSDTPSATTVQYTAFDLTGTVLRRFDDGSSASYGLSATNMSITVNLSAYTVSISMDVTGTVLSRNGAGSAETAPETIDLGTLAASDVGINDAPYGISGLFNYQDAMKDIPFEGWFFGPEGKEIGIVLTYASNDDDIVNRTWGTTGLLTLTASR